MNLLKYLLIAVSLLLTISTIQAQNNHSKTIEVKINGNCNMCKSNIENAGSIKKTSSVSWNKTTQIASIEFDATKITSNEILKKIALAGYDNESFLAPDDTYASLPECCQYERTSKNSSALMDHSKNNKNHEHSEVTDSQKSENQIQEVYNSYLQLKDAFVASNNKAAFISANNLLKVLNNVKMSELNEQEHIIWMEVMATLKQSTTEIANSKNLDVQRKNFITLSENLFKLLEHSDIEAPIYYQFCPMANEGKGATWLSNEEIIKNPYYGNQMLTCGSIKSTLK